MAPHCATFYNCGLTSFDFPRGRLKGLSVIDSAEHAEEVATEAATSTDSTSTSGTKTLLAGEDSDSSVVVQTASGGVAIAPTAITPELLASNPWSTYNTTNPAYIQFAFASAQVANQFEFTWQMSTLTQALAITAQASNDGSTWTTLGSRIVAGIGGAGEIFQLSVTNSTEYTYYRLTLVPSPITNPLFNLSLDGPELYYAAGDSVVSEPTPGTVTNVSATGAAASTSGGDWCDEIVYRQVEPCEIHNYLRASARCGYCQPFSDYFAIPRALCGNKGTVPTPTDEGVNPDLPPLPLGYHYPQESTDASTGRAQYGIWAIEGGRVYVAPWIESTETVVVKWEGIKRDWVDGDLVDDDPGLMRAVESFLRWEHARDWDSDINKAQIYEVEYRKALAELMYDCAEESRVRSCASERDGGASGARGIAPERVSTYTPDDQPPTPPPPDPSVQYSNDVDKVAFASCALLQVSGNPAPEGPGNTVTVKKGTVPGTSVADANQIAQDTANALAAQGIGGKCTFWNKEQSWTAECVAPETGTGITATEAEHTHSSTKSQAEANSLALQQAKNDANEALAASGNCSGPALIVGWNDRIYGALKIGRAHV